MPTSAKNMLTPVAANVHNLWEFYIEIPYNVSALSLCSALIAREVRAEVAS